MSGWLARWRERNEDGAALATVVIVGFVLLTLVTTGSLVAMSGMQKSSTDADWNAAMAAAYAGVDDYQSRLANDNSYVQYGNPAAKFSAGSAVALPASENSAFGVGTTGTWATVAGSSGAASYRYEVDNSQYANSGILKLRSTGRVGKELRSVVVNLKQQGFIDFLYFTDYEIQDPKYSGKNATTCTKYAWASRPADCSNIAFDLGDTTNGPAHSNDTIRICDATFNGPVTTAYNPTSGPRYDARNSNGTACSGQDFAVAGGPTYSPVIGMPPTNAQMKKEVRYDIPAEVPRPGCLYTGPTRITFNAGGTMTVRSPLTKATQINGAATPVAKSPAPTQCGDPAQLASATGQTIPVLDRNLIFVQNVPASSSDPNFTSTTKVPTACKTPTTSQQPESLPTNGLGYPLANEDLGSSSVVESYNCRYGDVFVEGDMHGLMSIAAENYVYVTGNIKYVDPQADMLGLVGNNAVWVWNPVNSSGSSLLSSTSKANRRIDAAILSVAHTFQVQNKEKGGDRGTLTVNGALAQKFRGIVRYGTNGYTNGYIKNYVYDARFRYMAPPKFLSPVTTTYGVSELVEVAGALNPDGSCVKKAGFCI
jgi:hypothetical protein